MSVSAPVYDKSDPKSEKLYPYHLPFSPEWEEHKDWFGQTAMMGSTAGMFLKNPLISWGCLLFAVIAFIQDQPLRRAKDAQSPTMGLGLAIMGVFALNLPKLMITPSPQAPVAVPVA